MKRAPTVTEIKQVFDSRPLAQGETVGSCGDAEVVCNPQMPRRLELAALVEFLRDCPGRISAAVVADKVAGDAVLEHLRSRSELPPLIVASGAARPEELGDLAIRLGAEDSILVLPFDGRHRLADDQAVRAFFRGLNYQRECLAQGRVRTLLLLNGNGERRLALLADDLWDWVAFFRFSEALVGLPAGVELPLLEASSEGQLKVLRSQYLRARHLDLPKVELVWHYVRPYFDALIAVGAVRKARRLWEQDLSGTETLELLPAEKRRHLLQSASRLSALAAREGFAE